MGLGGLLEHMAFLRQVTHLHKDYSLSELTDQQPRLDSMPRMQCILHSRLKTHLKQKDKLAVHTVELPTTTVDRSAARLDSIPLTVSVAPDARSTSKCRMAKRSFTKFTSPLMVFPR